MSYRGELNSELSTFTVVSNTSVSANTYVSFDTRSNNISGCSVSSNSITLPRGSYLVRGVIGGERSGSADSLTYRFEVDGSLVGSKGGLNTTYKSRVDDAKAQFSVSSTSTLKFKVIEESSHSSWTIEPNYTYILIIRSF